MRLGIFGGSFDPVHRGHMLLADCCAEQAELDEVWFVPAAHQPLKPAGPVASNADRLAMLQLVGAEQPKLVASTIEFDRGGVSYTVDTLETIHTQRPDDQLFFLMGADSLADFPNWHRPADICRLATPLVVQRAGLPPPDFQTLEPFVDSQRLEAIRQSLVEMPPTPISSSQIRSLIATRGEWQALVPDAAAGYIESNQLYVDQR